MLDNDWTAYVDLLRRKVVPALGCTEPIAVALAAARCRALTGEMPERLQVWVSGNLYKNGMGVGVPGTGQVGLPIAAAIGAVAGDATAGLEVLKAVHPADVEAATALRPFTTVAIRDVDDPLYAEVLAEGAGHTARVVICGGHTNVVRAEIDGVVVFEAAAGGSSGAAPTLPEMTLRRLFAFASEVPFEAIAFMGEAARLNIALSDEGLAGSYGLKIGATLTRQIKRGLLADDLMSLAMRLSSAASDARMDGAMLPAMSNSGSGNQGISATMPVVAAARLLAVDDERLVRAVAFSHLVAIYIKTQQNALSALCAASTAAMGAGAAITWLLGGDFVAIENCIHNMVGDVSGIICDGAKTSCSMKVSTSAAAAVKAAMLAADHVRVSASEGIVAETADQTIANLGLLSRQGMLETDRQIIRIMLDKEDARHAAERDAAAG
jgi:L-cysteine desulfidase